MHVMRVRFGWRGGILGAILLAAAIVLSLPLAGHAFANQPADKMTIGASTASVSAPGTNVTLLQAQMRTSTVEDLSFVTSLECSIVTDVTTTGTDSEFAQGVIQVWIEVDGQRVGVEPAQPGQSTDDGTVTFCDRYYKRATTFVDPTSTIKTYITTKDTHSFDWVAMNIGSGIHTIAVKADLTATSSNQTADAVVGNRTLVVSPTATAQNTAP